VTPPPQQHQHQQDFDDRRQFDPRGGEQSNYGPRKLVCVDYFTVVDANHGFNGSTQKAMPKIAYFNRLTFGPFYN
jgi:hypothetical protein